MIDLCKKCHEFKQVGSFFFEKAEPENHLTGFVASYSEDEILIKHISPDGFYDGYILAHIADLIRVDLWGKYERKIERLYTLREQNHPELEYIENSHFFSLMNWAFTNKLIISVELEMESISGYVMRYGEDFLHLQIVNKFGEMDGETVLPTKSIFSFAIDTTTEQSLKLLNQQGV